MRTTVLCSILCWFVSAVTAQPAIDTNHILAVLKSTPAAELPAAAALLVQQAGPEERIMMATNVVALTIRLNPAATVATVAAISHEQPSLAAVVAQTAARTQPQLAEDIARVATAMSPSSAGDIVERVGPSAMDDLRAVVSAASREAPGENRAIIRATGIVRPELRPYLEAEVARCGRNLPPVVRCFDQAEQAQRRVVDSGAGDPGSGSSSPRPAIPPTSKPPHDGGAPPGGRNYAKP